MPVVKVLDLAYVRLRSPDLDRAEELLSDCGMTRGTLSDHTVHRRHMPAAP